MSLLMTHSKKAIIWFRQDLRLKDNPALDHAIANGYKILPLFVQDDEAAREWKRGSASRWWLHQSLEELNRSLDHSLIFRKGNAKTIIEKLLDETGASAIFWNRCYEPWRITRDKDIKESLKNQGYEVQTFNGSLLWEPWEIKKDDGTPYRVFTPFYRKGCLKTSLPDKPTSEPKSIDVYNFAPKGEIRDLDLLDDYPWYKKFDGLWIPGEEGAQKRAKHFIKNGLNGYKELRNRPDLYNVSALSPHLHFGEISPRDLWHQVQNQGLSGKMEKDVDHFCSELGWREFSYSLLYYNPELPRVPLQEKFKNFPWQEPKEDLLEKWRHGKTGIPMVDAGMRQLWETGWMHNRVRMIVASFLIKNMMQHWHIGEEWFWDCLVDADFANNSASWQWVAGCGADAAPYFRIFNPITQGEKFDPNGDYIKKYIPELRNCSNVHEPWKVRDECPDYPEPILDIKETRERALEAFQGL